MAAKVPTIGDVVTELAAAFADAGFASPRLDARVLVGHVLGLEPSKLFARAADPFPGARRADMDMVKSRRLAHEPVGRIRGYREFFGQDYLLGPDTLEPRPDSETLVEAALTQIPLFAGRAVRILDLGTGTGCLLLAILSHWPEASGVGIDIALGAVAIATENAARLELARRALFQTGDWLTGVSGRFDLIVSNPPYIAERKRAALARDVTHYDPPRALFAGADGLSAYKTFVPDLEQHLAPGGIVFLEVGQGQAKSVAALCAAHGLAKTAFQADLAGVQRVVSATRA
jgi:release factor glutamine methyltransferase